MMVTTNQNDLPDDLSPLDREKLTLLNQCYELLTKIKRFVYRGGITFLLLLVVAGISLSFLISHLSDNVDNNTININRFGEDVKATRQQLEEAVRSVEERGEGNEEFTNQIKKGLEQIDKICQQTNCED